MKYQATLLAILFSANLQAQNFSQETVDSMKQMIATTDNDSLKVACYTKICGEFYFYDNDSILHYASKIADLAEKNNNKDYLATSDTEIGTAYWEKAQYDKAIFHYTRGLEYRKEEQDKSNDLIIADLSYNLGLCYTDKGDYQNALELFNEAIDYYDRSKNYQWKAHTSNAIGDIYIELENYDKAISNYRQAISTLPGEYNGAFDQGLFFCNLANGQFKLGEIDSSKYYVEKAIKIYKEEEMDWGMAFAYNIQSKIARVELDYEAAKRYGQYSLDYSTEQGTPSEMAEAYLLIGESGMLNKEMDYALRNALAGDSISMTNDLPLISMQAKKLLASIYENLGDTKSSYAYFKEYTILKDSLFSLDKIEELNQINLKFETAKRDMEIANQDLKIAQQKITRNYLLGGLGAIALLSLLIFYRSKSNKEITKPQE